MADNASSTESGSSLDLAAIRKGASITAFVLAIIMPAIGLVLSIATYIWAKRSGERGTLSLWGIVVGAVMLIAMVIVGFFIFTQLVSAAGDGALNLEALCVHRDRWGWLLDSLRYVCR
ncbi:MAG: hypothetical protein LCH76_07370 [Actinobacteria bacterium]|nr:hypothetical protein [Actinomycetota bacterium]